MSEIKTGGPAFPTAEIFHDEVVYTGGMTLRDYFAAKAMQATMARLSPNLKAMELAAALSYEMADAMIKAREEK
jgi:hypothetical protein